MLLCLFLCSTVLSAQDLKGIWRGKFYSGYGMFSDAYKYEVQINQLSDNSLVGVTYSYRDTTFYGKASFTGILFKKTSSVHFKETKLVELKMQGGSVACLMTCVLDYSKEGGNEYLKGTFSSMIMDTTLSCGSGTVVLQRVSDSEFRKEAFLRNSKPDQKYRIDRSSRTEQSATLKANEGGSAKEKENIKKLQKALGVPADGIPGVKTMDALKQKIPSYNRKLSGENSKEIDNLIAEINKKKQSETYDVKKETPTVKAKSDSIMKTAPTVKANKDVVEKEIKKKNIPVPDVLKSRSNPLVKTIVTNAPKISIQLYDNGQIDGDTITVYHNNEVIAWKKGLSDLALSFTIQASELDKYHEFVMVADNLGSIPPNTALMVIYADDKRHELFISSDKKKNAKVVIEYNPN